MRPLARLLSALLATTFVLCAMSIDSQAASVKLLKQEGLESATYLVEAAEGADKGKAIMAAREAAIIYAAREMTGDRKEKRKIGKFAKENVAKLIDFSMKKSIKGKGTSDDGERLSLKVVIKIQTKDLRLELIDAGVLTDDSDLADKLGTPTVLISYGPLVSKPGQTKLTDLGEVVTNRVTSFFTDKLWNIVDPETIERARNNVQAQTAMKGLVPDPNVELAIQSGADIYVTFAVSRSDSGRQCTASLKAVDTVTGKNLGTTVHNSKTYDSSTRWEKVYSEALMNAMPKFFAQIRAYWQEQAKKGRQYMFVVRADASSPLTRDRQRAIRDTLKELGKFKRGTRTESQIDGILMSSEDVSDIEDEFEDGLLDNGFEDVSTVIANGTLFIYQVR
jgi:hypothetical protein